MEEVVIETGPADSAFEPAVAGIGSSVGYAVAWADRPTRGIMAQRFSTSGEAIGPRITVATPAEANAELVHPAVGPRGFGFVVAWIEHALNPPGVATQVLAQVYNVEGLPVGDRVSVSATDVDDVYPPQLALMADGGFLVVWLARSSTDRIRAARFSPDGIVAVPAFTVNTTEGRHQRPMVTHVGSFNVVVGWELDPFAIGGTALRLRIFDFEGIPQSGEISPNVTAVDAAVDLHPSGFVVSWIKPGVPDEIGVEANSVEANLFTADGQSSIRLGASSGAHMNRTSAALAAGLSSGRYVVAWVEKRSDTFETTPVVTAAVMSDQGAIGADPVRRPISSTSDARRGSVAAAAANGEDESDNVLIVWVEAVEASVSLRGRVMAVTAGGFS